MTTLSLSRSIRLVFAFGVVAVTTRIADAQALRNLALQSATDSVSPPPLSSKAQTTPSLEPKALDILKAASARLAAAHSMSFTAIVTYENPSRLGFPLAYGTKSEVLLQRPDKLRVLTLFDGPASEFYYNGKTMMAFAPKENLVAVAAAPATVDAMLETAYHSAAVYFPFDDVIVTDPYKDIAQGLSVAFYVGQSHIVGGTTTDIVAYDSGGVFIEAWIGAEDKLPRLLRAIYDDDPLHLRHVLVFSDWKLDVTVPNDAFSSSTAASAKRIPFASPNILPGSPSSNNAVKPVTAPTNP
ncbi:DUF2092 domain-containing protein [Tunturiibacter gelidoferens]|jgi:hypothetical protein|uniref:DUF2092 domain-containing protein n=1 Tax=Tunturiibacter gelidiferens TaxID=3069689 RepID=A0A9X0QDT8_9BACT|nr:DUF2092 domain-containing protein [Edaphobacter lichenicola]MBB5328535.1 hypothetical protein [Edaphobacter lichenicola]